LTPLLAIDKSKSSSMELQDRARNRKAFGLKEITKESIEQIRLSNIVASIIAQDTKQIEIKFQE